MQSSILQKIKFKENSSIKKVLSIFNETAVFTEKKGFGVVVNKNDKCIGVITEGDIRRYLITGGSVTSNISEVINYNFLFIKNDYNYHNILRNFEKNIETLPILDKNNKLINILNYSDFKNKSLSANRRIIRARCPVRISFAGGGTDFNEFINHNTSTVLTSSINKYSTASVLVRNDEKINIISKDFDLTYSADNISKIKMGGKLNLIKAAIKLINPEFGFDIETKTDFKPGSGLGGSSSIVSAVIGALNYFRNDKHYDLYNIADLAYQAERLETGIKGGWQDFYACIFGGFNEINFKKDDIFVNPLKISRDITLELEYNLLLFKINKTRNSSSIQEKNIFMIKKSRSKFQKYFKIMNQLTLNMHKSLIKGNVKQFGDYLNESWSIKKKLNDNVSNTKIDMLNKIAIKNGALGCKLLGAGQSGYFLVYASPIYQKKIIELFEKKNLLLENFNFTNNGLEIWSTER